MCGNSPFCEIMWNEESKIIIIIIIIVIIIIIIIIIIIVMITIEYSWQSDSVFTYWKITFEFRECQESY